MRNYVIINGTNSLTIPGLAIRELPAISKTLMRNQKEEIDGRDGDIITELGYSAYDKTMTIGLYGTYDINQIIAFFNQKGTIVFSDEDDKYYNFTILEKIDYDKLVKFRTATIRIHCQPFKYPLTETPVEIEAEYVTATGEDITLNNTGVAPLEIGLKGNTYQETTTGKNLANISIIDQVPSISNGQLVSFAGAGCTELIEIDNTKNMTLSYELSTNTDRYIFFYNASEQLLGHTDRSVVSGYQLQTSQYYSQTKYIRIRFDNVSYIKWVQLEYATTPTSYEPYTNGASPNPDYPQEVQVVTGDNTIKVEGKNLFSGWVKNQRVNNTNGAVTIENRYLSTNSIRVNENTQYYIKGLTTDYGNKFVAFYDKNNNYLSRTGANNVNAISFTTPSSAYYCRVVVNSQFSTDNDMNSYVENTIIQLELGNQATDYTPYQSQEYEINLGTLELCKIGTYQDYLYKSGENWYKHKEIAKTKLLSTWSWFRDNEKPNSWRYYTQSNAIPNSYNNEAMSNYFKGDTVANVNNIDSQAITTINYTQIALRINKTIAPTKDDLITWLSNNEVYIYTILSTPTEEQITNAELIEQLNDILNAVSYEDQTNINQDNDNMAFILDVSALKKGTDMAIVNNGGNIAAKPIIAVKGNGTLGIYLDNTQMFSLNMTSDITIDTENMEAYDPNTSQLRNRQVTGDYSKFALQPGNNTIKVTGDFTSVTISKFQRWL